MTGIQFARLIFSSFCLAYTAIAIVHSVGNQAELAALDQKGKVEDNSSAIEEAKEEEEEKTEEPTSANPGTLMD